MRTPLHRLVLPFGLVIAAAAFVYWTTLGYVRYGMWLPDGLFRAVFVLGAILLLSGVLRVAQQITERGGP